MKFTIDVDCTPEEARVFLGLPDVKPMQESLMAEVEARMKANLEAMDPETMVKTWLPMAMKGGLKEGMKGFEQMQKAFFAGAAAKPDDEGTP